MTTGDGCLLVVLLILTSLRIRGDVACSHAEANGRLSNANLNGEIPYTLPPDSLFVDSYSSAASHLTASPAPLASFADNPQSAAASGSGAAGGGQTMTMSTSADGSLPLSQENQFEETIAGRTLPAVMSASPKARDTSGSESTVAGGGGVPAAVAGVADSAQLQRAGPESSRTTAARATPSQSASGTGGHSNARALHTTGRSPPAATAAAAAAAGGRMSSGRARRPLWFYLVPSVLFAILLLFVALVFLLETDLLPAAVRQSSGVAQLDHIYRPFRSRFVTFLRDL